MNKVFLIGRLTKDPEVRRATAGTAVARYTLAVDRRFKDENGERTADFINISAFGKSAEFAEKYLFRGTKISLVGRISTSTYEKDGKRMYRTEVMAEEQEFCESKRAESNDMVKRPSSDGFVPVPDDVADDLGELPFA